VYDPHPLSLGQGVRVYHQYFLVNTANITRSIETKTQLGMLPIDI